MKIVGFCLPSFVNLYDSFIHFPAFSAPLPILCFVLLDLYFFVLTFEYMFQEIFNIFVDFCNFSSKIITSIVCV